MVNFAPYTTVKSYSHLFFKPAYVLLSNGYIQRAWQSRSHRKGRSLSFRVLPFRKNVEWLKAWDVSWWTAVFFLVGSAFWIANGIIAFHKPISDKTMSQNVMAYTAFAGGTLFFFGGWTMYWEALNTEKRADFDIAIRKQMKAFLTAIINVLHCRTRRVSKPNWRWIGWDSVKDSRFVLRTNRQ